MKKSFLPARSVILFQLCVCSLLLGFFVSFASGAETQNRVLMISSYHPGFPTFFQQIEGVKSAFKDRSVILDVEFMDTKRFNQQENWNNFYQMLSYKLERAGSYDLVMTADDNALTFALEHLNGVLGNTPLVFFGVNNISLAEKQNSNPLVTGVVESVSMEETVALMVKLNPKANRVVALVDGTPSGQGDLKTFYELEHRFENKVFHEISLADHSFNDFFEKVKSLDGNDLVLLLSAFRDKNNKVMLFDESLQATLSNLSQPLFHLWYHGLGDGILGGKVISHFHQGKTAAEMAGEILDGKPVKEFSVSRVSPNKYIFDYKVMKQHKLRISDFPEKSFFIGKPESFYTQHKEYVWFFTTVFGVLCLIVIFMALYIIQKKQTMRALRESEDKFASFVNQAGDAIFVCDYNGAITDVNQHAVDVMGYSREEFLKINVIDLDAKYDSEENIMPILERLLVESPITFESVHKRKDGTTFPVELRAGLLSVGGKRYILGLARDISERKNSEKEKDLLEFQLRQALKMESIGTLTGGIAHDFNNILGIILGNTELALDDISEGKPGRNNLEEIEKASLRAKDIVQQLLHFSRQNEQNTKSVSIIPIIHEVVRLLTVKMPANVKIQEQIPAISDTVIADPAQIHQILVNLITNAAHSMEDEGGEIEVRVSHSVVEPFGVKISKLPPGRYFTLNISDTGQGIDADIIDRIFDPYFTTRDVGQGSGMGLAIVHGIVKSFGGYITVKSRPGEGTEFDVSLPLCEEEILSEVGKPKECPVGHKGHERILFVDDEQAIVDLGKKILEGVGYDVVVKTNPAEALELLYSQPDRFDLVITDMSMPKLSGDKLLKEIMSIRPDMPVILCTGFSEGMTAEKAKAAGAEAFVLKPIKKYDLVVLVRKLLDQKKT